LRIAPTSQTLKDPQGQIAGSGAPLLDGHNCKARATRLEQQKLQFHDAPTEGSLTD